MENRNGYGYGIWLLLTPLEHVTFHIEHKFHITLMSNIYCKRKATDLYLKISNDYKNSFPKTIELKNPTISKFIGEPLSANAWSVNIDNWNIIKNELNHIYPQGKVPEVPHISLEYFRGSNFETCDKYMKKLSFKVDLCFVDMNENLPKNWKVKL